MTADTWWLILKVVGVVAVVLGGVLIAFGRHANDEDDGF